MAADRTRWMDFTRGICILLVLLLHASSALSASGIATPDPIQLFNKLFEPFRMTLLMFLSGMLLEKSLSKPAGEYIWGKLAQIYWPFLVWSMVILAAENRLTLEYILKTPISAPTLLWYLWFLCAYYLLALGMRRFSIPLIPVMIVSLIIAPFLPDFIRMSRFAYLFVFFLAGHYVASHRAVLPGSGLLALCGLVLAVVGGVLNASGWEVRYNSLYVWAPLGLIVFILWVSAFYARSVIGDGLEWIGRNSIVFYVAHFPVQLLVSRMIGDTSQISAYAPYVITLVASLAACAGLQIIRKHYRIIGGLFDFRKLQPVLP